jgi:hypothetical protein
MLKKWLNYQKRVYIFRSTQRPRLFERVGLSGGGAMKNFCIALAFTAVATFMLLASAADAQTRTNCIVGPSGAVTCTTMPSGPVGSMLWAPDSGMPVKVAAPAPATTS